MKISFHGAAQTVTGSKHLIQVKNGKNILLDCGMFQGLGSRTFELNENWGFDPSSVDLLILSHAHIDHSGLVPKLVKDGFKGDIIATGGTIELMAILLQDSADIQASEYRNASKNNHGPVSEPLFSSDDVAETLASTLR